MGYRLRWLAYLTGAMTFYWVLRSVDSLLKQVQESGSDQFGGMESLGGGLLPGSAMARTGSLLRVWHAAEAQVRETIVTTATLYTLVDGLLILCCLALLVDVCRRLHDLPAHPDASVGARWELFHRIAVSGRAWRIPVVAAAADAIEDVLRWMLVREACDAGDGYSPPGMVVGAVWLATTAKIVLLVLSVAVIVLLAHDRGVTRGRWGSIWWSVRRLRVPIGATLAFAGLLLGDPTGQGADLIRSWIDSWADAGRGVFAVAGAALLGFTGWLITRRLVLASQDDQSAPRDDASAGRRREELRMTWIWIGVGVVAAGTAMVILRWGMDRETSLILAATAAILLVAMLVPGSRFAVRFPLLGGWRAVLLIATVAAWIVFAVADWRELGAPATVATAVLVLEVAAWAGRRPPATGATLARQRDLAQPEQPDYLIARRMARFVALAAPVAMLIAAAGAFAPVPLVLRLSGQSSTSTFWYATLLALFLLVAPAATAVGGYLGLRALDGEVPRALELRYQWVAPLVVFGAALGLIGGAAHWAVIGPLSIVAAFLATVIIVLGEAQLRSERHEAPPSFLLAGFTRVPPVTLLVLTALVAGLAFSDSSGHAVFRSGLLPTEMTSGPMPESKASGAIRQGIDLDVAFQQWAARNCADAAHKEPVPMVLVSAPGGGLRAAYWTASSLSDLFPGQAASCPGAAASNRVFAVGGASGGSLGELAWIGGLAGDRDATWYDTELARPDFLTDPLAWLLTVDLARSYLGYHGQDRARRLENRWTHHVPGLGGDFLGGSWGLGGTDPVPLLTGTQVETGCRLNVGGLRITDPVVHRQESSCTTVHEGAGQQDAPAVSDLLDYVCGPERGSPGSGISRATAALLSARFPWVSPSGQLYRCADQVAGTGTDATRIAVVDGGYADNTGMGLLLDVWPRLEKLIAAHNATGGAAPIVPVFLEVDNHYAAVAAPAAPAHTVETLVPPLTRDRPDELDDLTLRARTEAIFDGPVPGLAADCDVDPPAGRYLRISPKISPGLPAPLAWKLSKVATEDLRGQRIKALREPGPAALKLWAEGTPPALCRSLS
ncbi:hypothetical protein [Winogradskya humida]|uniref:Patatin-like phospholipase n=1 Tax=Winogradskya humida TaxID=113566 RepID=A0ABQ3ZUB4_9ACTN|nr:hypothetical protein [Actinoplanes humidus]GIE22191.1 hypothetical protein Ahu01nite_052930 [Actinoplanes humidus]